MRHLWRHRRDVDADEDGDEGEGEDRDGDGDYKKVARPTKGCAPTGINWVSSRVWAKTRKETEF